MDMLRVSELLDGGTLDTSVLIREMSRCGDLVSATFSFPFCFFLPASTEKSILLTNRLPNVCTENSLFKENICY